MNKFPNNIEIKTERLILRPIKLEDAPILYKAASVPEIAQYMTWKTPKNFEETESFVKNTVKNAYKETYLRLAVIYKWEICWQISLENIQEFVLDSKVDNATMWYWMFKKFQGKWIMTEAVKWLIDFAFKILELNKLKISHHWNNIASQKVIKKLWFKYVWIYKKDFFKDNLWGDSIVYELLNSLKH